MKPRTLRLLILAIAAAGLSAPVRAHNLPVSGLELRIGETGIDARIEAPATDLAHDLPAVAPDTLLTPAGAERNGAVLVATLAERLIIEAKDGKRLRGHLLNIEPLPERGNVRLRLRFAWTEHRGARAPPPGSLRIRCRLFPYDPRHKTFLSVYQDGTLERQAVFERDDDMLDYRLGGGRQRTLAVVRQFLVEGVHHIFIGPDHILFIVGLLLLGGTLRQLLKIVTTFTVAHSVTLGLATLGILNPTPRIIEPAIALSIVFVGMHSFTANEKKRDLRLLFAFCFGFIHGFGFASVLREMDLPRTALGWSLFSFNAGVEIGQACIVLAVAPPLALLRRWSEPTARRVVVAGSLGVIAAGAFWFVQRLISPA